MDKKGFTMTQLIITLGVLAVLATAVIIAFDPSRRMGQANDARRYEDIESIAKALELYQIDNDQLPSDFTDLNIWDTHKVVLCSSAAELTCDGQTRDCLVVDDSDFLGEYLPELPIDPIKSSSLDTGYYITRDNDRLAFGVCDTYDDDDIEYVAKVALAAYNASCGDGYTEGDEVCDDGNNDVESCGDGATQNGDYCNANCTAVLTLSEVCDDSGFVNECGNGVLEYGDYCNATCDGYDSLTESCEYYTWTDDCDMGKIGWVTEADLGGYGWCQSNCRLNTGACIPPPF